MSHRSRRSTGRAGTSVLAGLALLLCHVALVCHGGSAHSSGSQPPVHGSGTEVVHGGEAQDVLTSAAPAGLADAVAPGAQVTPDDPGAVLVPGVAAALICLVMLARWRRHGRRSARPVGTITLRRQLIRPPPLLPRSIPVLTLVCVSRT